MLLLTASSSKSTFSDLRHSASPGTKVTIHSSWLCALGSAVKSSEVSSILTLLKARVTVSSVGEVEAQSDTRGQNSTQEFRAKSEDRRGRQSPILSITKTLMALSWAFFTYDTRDGDPFSRSGHISEAKPLPEGGDVRCGNAIDT